MQLQLSDRQKQVVIIALEMLRQEKQKAIAEQKPHEQINEYDIISDSHALMHSITLLHNLTGQPMTHFMNRLQPKTEPVATVQLEPENTTVVANTTDTTDNKQPDEPLNPS